MILNAKDVSLTSNPGTLPNMQAALLDYFQAMTFTVITKAVVDHESVETRTQTSTRGVWQPLSPQKVMMKPEGQRHWKWQQIHAVPDLVLEVDSVIEKNGEKFRIMDRLDYREYGYVEYHAQGDFLL